MCPYSWGRLVCCNWKQGDMKIVKGKRYTDEFKCDALE